MRRAILVGAAVALVATAVVAVPAWAQNQEVAPTPAAVGADPPAKPHNLGASAEHDEVTLTWTASTDQTVTHYAILRRNRDVDAVGVFHVIEANAGPETSYTDSSVSASSTYVYRAKAVSPTGVSQWSGYVRADTPAAPEPATADQEDQKEGASEFVQVVPRLAVFTDADSVVPLNWALTPSGLAAGDRFRLLFITYAGHAPTSTDIEDCNAYVQSQANASNAHSAIKPYASGFRVVGSTADDDARDNASTAYTSTAKGLPIYWLNGSKVADDYEDFHDGSWDDEANPRGRNGNKVGSNNTLIWTGSNSNGIEAIANGNSQALGSSTIALGCLNFVGGPIDCAANSVGNYSLFTPNSNHRYYALSGVFTVGGSVPVFTDSDPAARSVAENPGGGANVGAAVAASDADAGDTVRYSLGGADAGSFAIDPTSGQIRTRSGVGYDFEAKPGYSVQVRASDGTHTATNTAAIAVTITVTDAAEPPRAPAAPRARTVAAMTDRLAVHWTAPANSGPPITDYDVQYRLSDSGAWNDVSHTGTARTAAVTGLSAANIDDVAVQVRATNGEGTGAYSKSSPALYDICGRTAQVIGAILAATPGADSCDSISWQDMAAIAELDLSDNRHLRAGDWPADTFDGLDSLETLRLANMSYRGRSIKFVNNDFYNGLFDGLANLRELDVRPSTPHLGAPLALAPMTSLVTYNTQPYARPIAAPQNLTATISDIAGSIIVRARDDRGRLTGEKTRFCKTVTLNWAAPAGAAGITGYKIMRTHYGHPVISRANPNTDYRRYGYDIATLAAGDRSYVHEPLRPGANGHTFTYYVAAVTPDGVGFPAVVNVSAPIKIRWNSTGTMTTGPDVLPCPMLE
ncbi:fibronectin type III domain-containing protein [Candidatus Poriferisodalis sp.]|uniref:fibronectin type III domain-containing protein n=1 Tax=Candidatus Poriferisodalis sp. TaxID=3101277 RepID=UPI003C70177F